MSSLLNLVSNTRLELLTQLYKRVTEELLDLGDTRAFHKLTRQFVTIIGRIFFGHLQSQTFSRNIIYN